MDHNDTGIAQRRSAQIGLTAVTTAGLLAGATSAAQAEIIVTNANLTTNLALSTSPTDGRDIFFNFTTKQVQKTAFTGYQYRLNSTATGANLATNGGTTSFLTYCGDPNRFTAGDQIGEGYISGANAGTGTGVGNLRNTSGSGNWLTNSTGFIGVRFGTDGNYNYGWADLNVGSDNIVTLNQFAYETVANQAITAGALPTVVPEANPLELLLLGAAGLGAYRLLQKKREAVDVSA